MTEQRQSCSLWSVVTEDNEIKSTVTRPHAHPHG